MFSLAGKVALVTGASRGLGWAMAQALAKAGALHCSMRETPNARRARAAVAGTRPARRSGRLRRHRSRRRRGVHPLSDCAPRALRHSGGERRHPHRKPITEFETADFQRVLDTNLTAVWALCREAARAMIPAKRGRIILTGSVSALLARPTISAYVASKGAVHAFTRELAVELAPHNVTVNAIAPGYFATEMNTALIENKEFNDWVCKRTPAGRWGAPRRDRTRGGVSRLGRGVVRQRPCLDGRWGVECFDVRGTAEHA